MLAIVQTLTMFGLTSKLVSIQCCSDTRYCCGGHTAYGERKAAHPNPALTAEGSPTIIDHVDAKPEVIVSEAHWTVQRRAAGAVLAAGAVIFFLAEFIAAAAWTDPPYSYSYHYISDLGVHGPLEALDQYMYSPLAWVMNTGFFLFGITVFAGVAMLNGLRSWRRWVVLILATLVGVGGVALAFFHGDGEADRQGTVDYHSLGAMAAIVGGNVLVILLGRMHRHLGVARKPGTAMVMLGAFGLVSMVAFLAVAGSGANVLVGLVERCAVYPVLIGLICAGVSIWNRRPLDTPQTPLHQHK